MPLSGGARSERPLSQMSSDLGSRRGSRTSGVALSRRALCARKKETQPRNTRRGQVNLALGPARPHSAPEEVSIRAVDPPRIKSAMGSALKGIDKATLLVGLPFRTGLFVDRTV